MGRDQHDWSADYRVFSKGRFDPNEIFSIIARDLLAYVPPDQAVVVAVDDTNLQKTGTKIPGVAYRRDPMSPPFRPNLIRAQRFIQASLSVPLDTTQPGESRAFPIRFRHAPSVKRPNRNADAAAQAEYRNRCREDNLSIRGVELLRDCRAEMDRHHAEHRRLIVTVDGSYTNRTVLRNLPARTTLLGRIRKDAKLFYLPTQQPLRGRKRSYGEAAPRPDELRKDESVPWQTIRVWASGSHHECQVKTLGPVLTPVAGAQLHVRIIVIRPLRYRLSNNSKLLYRSPAYLICTDPDLPIEQAVQSYFRRWDIEVNHRDEKQLIGTGQAQVRSPLSAERLPAFAVSVYSLMLLAAAKCYGFDAKTPPLPQPSWRSTSAMAQSRVTTGQIIQAIQSVPLGPHKKHDQPNFSGFETAVARHLKRKKSEITPQQAIEYALYPS